MAIGDDGIDVGNEGGIGSVDGPSEFDGAGNDGTGATGTGATDPAKFAKRGRGRPKGSGKTGEASDSGSEEGTTASKARRNSSGSLDSLNADLFATQLVGAHKMLAMVTKQPCLEIDQKEGKNLAIALKNVMALHKINISPSTLAYLQLMGVGTAIYGPRIAVIVATNKMQSNMKKPSEKQTETATDVSNMMSSYNTNA